MLEQAVRAAGAVAAEHGLVSDAPRVLASGANVVVHLAPAPVVARVVHTFALVPRGPDFVQRQLDVAAFLADAGIAVVAPSPLLPAVAVERAGLLLGFWELADHDGGRPLDVDEAVARLLELEAALAGYGGDLPHFARLAEVATVLDRLEARGAAREQELELLRTAHRGLARRVAELELDLRPVHADAHLGNVLRTPAGPVWSDFDTVCRGPRELDAVSLVHRARMSDALEHARAVEAYGPYDETAFDAVEPFVALFLCCWTAALVADRPEARPLLERRLAWLEPYAREM